MRNDINISILVYLRRFINWFIEKYCQYAVRGKSPTAGAPVPTLHRWQPATRNFCLLIKSWKTVKRASLGRNCFSNENAGKNFLLHAERQGYAYGTGAPAASVRVGTNCCALGGGSPAKLATDSAAARGSAINEAFDGFREERTFYPHRSSKNCYRSSEARFATFSMLN